MGVAIRAGCSVVYSDTLMVLMVSLQASTATPQLKYLAKVDFTPVKIAATKALVELGELIERERECKLYSR